MRVKQPKNQNHALGFWAVTAFSVAIALASHFYAKPGRPLPSRSQTAGSYPQTAFVREVVDGDTIRLSTGQLLRYIGLDTPETRLRRNNRFLWRPQPFALDAKELNRSLVEGKQVRIEYDVEKTDSYNRLLGYCFVGDTFVNARLIEKGLAVSYAYPPNVKYTDTFIALQHQVRAAGKSIWSQPLLDSRAAGACVDQIRAVRGRVTGARDLRKVLVIELEGGFRVIIYRDSREEFKKRGIDPVDYYQGKTIEVCAKIRSYKGNPEIIVGTPGEIIVENKGG